MTTRPHRSRFCLAVFGLWSAIAAAQDDRFDARPLLASGSPLQSVATADLDGDGDTDVVAAEASSGRIVWLENNSDVDPGFTIEHEISSSVIGPLEIAVSDIDGDGDIDVAAAASSTSGTVVWFENLGGVPPVFQARAVGARPSLETTGIVRSVALADLNGDGNVDIVTGFELPTSAASGHVSIYVNNGAPTPGFVRVQLPSPSGTLREVTGVAVADVNNNGTPDVVAVSRTPQTEGGADSIVIWQNSGGSTPSFAPSIVANQLGDPAALAVATITNDSLPDIAVAVQTTGRVLTFANRIVAPGTFQTPVVSFAPDVQDLAAADVVGTLLPDLVAATSFGPLVLQNTSSAAPSFNASVPVSPDGAATTVALDGIDGDADRDIVAAGPNGSRWFERVEPVQNVTQGSTHSSLADAVASVGSGDVLRAAPEHFVPDIVLPATTVSYDLESTGSLTIGPRASFNTGANLVLRSQIGQPVAVDGPLTPSPGSQLEVESTEPVAITSSQILNDVRLRSVGSSISLHLSPEWDIEEIDGDFSASPTPLSRAPRDAKFFRPSNDDAAAIVTVSEVIGGGIGGGPGTLAVYTQSSSSPTGWIAQPVDAVEEGLHRSVAVGDLNRDGHDDIVSVFQPSSGGVDVLRLHFSDGASPPNFATIFAGPAVATGAHVVFDLDRDGLADVVTPTGYYRQTGQQTLTFLPFPLVGSDRGIGVSIARLEPDFEPDVVVHTAILSGTQNRAVGFRLVALRSDGAGGFVPTVIDTLDRSTDPTCIGDCYPETNAAITNKNTVLAADFDHDGDDDIVLSEDQGLTVFENGASLFYEELFDDDELRWDESAATDVNGDGTLDLVVASTRRSAVVGILDPLQAFPDRVELVRPFERVAAIDAGDVDGDDDPDLLLAGSGFNRLALLRQGDLGDINLIGSTARLQAPDTIDLTRGSLTLTDGEVLVDGDVRIRRRGVLRGSGQITGTVFNGGTLIPRPSITVTDDYVQSDATDATQTGALDVLLQSFVATPLTVGQTAGLVGDLRIAAVPGAVLGPSPRRLVEAQAFEPGVDRFDTTLVPRLDVTNGGTPQPGVGIVEYGQGGSEAFAELRPDVLDPVQLVRTDFPAFGIPADATVGDVAGGSDGGPDGVLDLVVAYPEVEGDPVGAIALFVGERTETGCTFRPIGLYRGKAAAGPVAVEIGDFTGEGRPQIAIANGGGTFASRLVSLLDVDSNSQVPLTDSPIPPLELRGDRVVSDLTVIDLFDPPGRGVAPARTLLALSSGGVGGTVTAATYRPGIEEWEVCDIDVCDDPDSFDPIDPDGAASALGDGFASTSTGDDKVLVSSNAGGMPEDFPEETFAAGSNPTEIRTGDITNDGFPDIVAINEVSGTLSVYINIADASGPGGRSFTDGTEWTLRSAPDDPEPLPSSVALADLDDDEDIDIAVVSTDGSGARVVRALTNLLAETGELSFTVPSTLPTQPVDTPLIVREFDAEAKLGGFVINDDLVVLTEPPPGGSRNSDAPAGPTARGGSASNAILCSETAVCLPDVNGDGIVSPADFNAWILAFNQGLPTADQNGDGLVTPADFNAWILNYNAGC